MKREQQHTPTPWQVSYTVPSNRLDSQKVMAITASHPDGGGQTIAEALEADAQYIVTAVNSHVKLIEALRDVVENGNCLNDVHARAVTALAAAEAGTDDDPVNAACVGCGRSDLPLHTDYRCPDCHEAATGSTTGSDSKGLCQCARGSVHPNACIDRLRNTGKHKTDDAFDRETEEITSYDYRNEQEAERKGV